MSFTGTGFGKARRVTRPINGMGRKPLQGVFEVDERIDLVSLATCHEAIQGCRCLGASITPYKKVIVPSNGLRCTIETRKKMHTCSAFLRKETKNKTVLPNAGGTKQGRRRLLVALSRCSKLALKLRSLSQSSTPSSLTCPGTCLTENQRQGWRCNMEIGNDTFTDKTLLDGHASCVFRH